MDLMAVVSGCLHGCSVGAQCRNRQAVLLYLGLCFSSLSLILCSLTLSLSCLLSLSVSVSLGTRT